MRIAVCFSGQTRTSTEAFPNLRRFFGTAFNNIDFFIHTWDIAFQKKAARKEESPRLPVPQERFDQLINLYNPKKIEIEKYNESRNSIDYYPTPLFYSWYKSIMLCRDYEIENNFKYDAVVKLRTDIIFPSYRFFMSGLEYYLTDTNKFYIQGFSSISEDDVYWLASSHNMLKATDFINRKTNDLAMKQFPIKEFIKFLREEEIILNPLDPFWSSYAILRDECLHLDALTNFRGCFECDHHYYNAHDVPWPMEID
jgi:hypothetical protein